MTFPPTTNMRARACLHAKPLIPPTFVLAFAPHGFTLLVLAMSALLAGCSAYPTLSPAYKTSSQPSHQQYPQSYPQSYSQQNSQQNSQSYPQQNRQSYQPPATGNGYADNGWIDNGYADSGHAGSGYADTAYPPVVSVYVEPPISQPTPVFVGWAPPPMLVETSVAAPYASAAWVGGYWVWSGNWVWAAGHWMAPPRPDYFWVQPYYEHRERGVIFITGHWAAPGTEFTPPAPNLQLTLVRAAPGVLAGPAPIGPMGVFVPPPPGSRMGLIVPAPIGTSPAVVTSAAPVVNVGMRIQNNTTMSNASVNNWGSTNTNNTNSTNSTNNTNYVANINNVTIIAPAGATTDGRAFQSSVPAQAYLAAALPAVIRVAAPVPRSTRAIPSFATGQTLPQLPAAQTMPAMQTLPAQQVQRRDARSSLPAAAAAAAAAASTPMSATPSAPTARPTFDAQPRAERALPTSAIVSQPQPMVAPQIAPLPALRTQTMSRPMVEPMPASPAERPNPALTYPRQAAPRATPDTQTSPAAASIRSVAPAPTPQAPAVRSMPASPNLHSAPAPRSAREEAEQKARRADRRE